LAFDFGVTLRLSPAIAALYVGLQSDELRICKFPESEIRVSTGEELAGFRFVCPPDNNPPDVRLDCSDLPLWFMRSPPARVMDLIDLTCPPYFLECSQVRLLCSVPGCYQHNELVTVNSQCERLVSNESDTMVVHRCGSCAAFLAVISTMN
jgi:hypothetical protein